MDLSGRVYVVAGGAGVAGESVAAALLGRGATVAVTSRSRDRLQEVLEVLDSPRAHGFAGEMDRLNGLLEVRGEILAKLGGVDGVVASLGGWWEGPPLTQLDEATWDRIVADNLTSHFLAARAFLPVIADRPGGVYVMLGGVGATKPIPHAGPISVTGAAQTALLEVLDSERLGVRMHEVRIMTPVVTRRWDRPDRDPEWLTGVQVGDFVADVVSAKWPRPAELVLCLPPKE